MLRDFLTHVIHRWEDGQIAWSATLRYLMAGPFPFWDGDAPGRAYTPREMVKMNLKLRK